MKAIQKIRASLKNRSERKKAAKKRRREETLEAYRKAKKVLMEKIQPPVCENLALYHITAVEGFLFSLRRFGLKEEVKLAKGLCKEARLRFHIHTEEPMQRARSQNGRW